MGGLARFSREHKNLQVRKSLLRERDAVTRNSFNYTRRCHALDPLFSVFLMKRSQPSHVESYGSRHDVLHGNRSSCGPCGPYCGFSTIYVGLCETNKMACSHFVLGALLGMDGIRTICDSDLPVS